MKEKSVKPCIPLEPLSVKTNFTYNFAGKITYAASRAITIILIAKMGSAEMIGQYTLALAVTSPVFMFADLDLRAVYVTDSLNRFEYSSYLGLRILTTVLSFFTVCVISVVLNYNGETIIILLVGIIKCIETVSDLLYGSMQKEERLDKLGISQILNGVFSILSMGILLYLFHSVIAGLAGVAFSLMLVMLFYELRVARMFASVRIRMNINVFRVLIRLCLPLGFVLLINSLNKNIANYFIEVFHGFEALGYFSSMVYMVTVGNLTVAALTQSRNAKLARLFAAGDIKGFLHILYRMIVFVLILCILMMLAGIAAGEEILTLLFQSDYAAYSSVFVIILGAAGILYIDGIINCANTSARQFKLQPVAFGIVLLAGLILNRLLVPSLGLTGAAICLLAASFIQLSGNFLILSWTIRKKIRSITPHKPDLKL